MKPKALLSLGKAEMKKLKAEIRRRVVPISAFLLAVFFSGCGQQAEQARQRAEKELETVRAELEAVKTERGNLQNETSRLRKDNEDLLRLRNEVRQLRDAQKQLTQQAQSAQTEIQRAQAQTQAAQAQAAQAQAQAQAVQAHAQALATNAAQALTPEQQAFAARYGLNNPQSVAQANACINNLRQIDSAKQQWALEKGKTEAAIPTAQDLAAYLRGVLPKCPAGGSYTLNAIIANPTCSIPGHALQ
jgi:uncharacterized protein YoxC